MALVVTIAGVNRTAVLEDDSIRITQLADSFTFTAELALFDAISNISITAGSHKVADEITIVDGATTYFGGYVVNQDIETAEGGSRHLALQCQGYGILLNEALVEFEEYGSAADATIIDDLFDTYLAVIDSVTHVDTIFADMDISFTEMTLAEIMDAICQRTQGRWYVDNDKKLHYFATNEAYAGFDLSDEPNDVTSFSYHDRVKKVVDAAAIVNRIRVIGADDFAVTRNDGDSQTAYGIRGAIVTDHSLASTAELEDRGDAILDKNKDPRITYIVRTFHDGAVAGDYLGFRCDELGYNSIDNGDDPLVIREMNIYWAQGRPVYEMTLGTHADISAISRASYTGTTIRKIIVDPSIPLASRGWSHDIEFVATDYRTVKWVDGGTIALAGGVGSFTIAANAGNSTGNMAAVTYIYLDADISTTALQTDDSAANAVGKNKILIAVAGPVADEDTNKAVFQVFGGEGTGVLILADNIGANVITANEMAANSIVAASIVANAVTADKIQAGAVVAAKIAAGAVVADKLSIGEAFFNEADGLMLINPPAKLMQEGTGAATANYIYDKRGERCQIGAAAAAAGDRGALHFEPGRWPGTQGLVIEETVNNQLTNPSLETNATGWTWAANAQGGGFGRVGDDAFKGNYCGKAVCTGVGGRYVYIAGSRIDGEDVTVTVWVRTVAGTAQIKMSLFDSILANGSSSGNYTIGPTWTRIEHTVADAVLDGWTDGGIDLNLLINNNTDVDAKTWLFDAAQFERKAYSTTYCDGSLGDGYAWSAAAHASVSARVASYILLDDYVALISANDTLSFRVVAQMPYDYDATWPGAAGVGVLFEAKAAGTNIVQLQYDGASDTFRVYIMGGWRLASAAQMFLRGDWVDLVVTLDFAADSYNLYVDGVLADTDTTAMASVALTEWNLGSGVDNTRQGGFVFSEYAVFDRVVTAAEAAQAYNLQRPLIDTGSTEKPGIYILDGQFRIQSSQTGNRIQIDADEIAGYNGAGAKQFYLRASDGKAMAGGGVVALDADGIDIAISTAAADVRAYKFNLSGTVFSGLWAYAADAWSHVINLEAKSIASRSPTVGVYSRAPATTPAYVNLMAKSGAGDFAQIILTADGDAAVKKQINFNADKFDFSIAAVPFAVTSIDGYIPFYFNGVLRKIAYGTFT